MLPELPLKGKAQGLIEHSGRYCSGLPADRNLDLDMDLDSDTATGSDLDAGVGSVMDHCLGSGEDVSLDSGAAVGSDLDTSPAVDFSSGSDAAIGSVDTGAPTHHLPHTQSLTGSPLHIRSVPGTQSI